MPLWYNKTKCTQILDVKGYAIPTAIHPGMLFDPSPYIIVSNHAFEEFNISKIKSANRIVTLRQYALGDLIQLIPVLRKVRTEFNIKSVGIITTERFREALLKTYPDIEIYAQDKVQYTGTDFVFNMDGLLEKDHSLQNLEKHKHRVQIYLDFFGLKADKDLNWSAKIQTLKFNIGEGMKTIGLQIRGSGPIKTLPYDFVKRIAYELSKNYKVVLLDNDKSVGFEGKNILNLCGKINVPECIAVLSKIDGAITMDSGMLWMAHSAKCPVVTFLGSTREAERMSLHPLYPEKARSINLAKLVGCEPCFETRVRCKGKHFCVNNFDRDQVMEILKNEIQTILGE